MFLNTFCSRSNKKCFKGNKKCPQTRFLTNWTKNVSKGTKNVPEWKLLRIEQKVMCAHLQNLCFNFSRPYVSMYNPYNLLVLCNLFMALYSFSMVLCGKIWIGLDFYRLFSRSEIQIPLVQLAFFWCLFAYCFFQSTD